MLSFGEARPLKHAAHLRLVDEEAEMQREHAAWEKAERRRI